MKTIFGLILFFSLCGLGNAQSQSTDVKFSDKLYEQSEVVDKISGNVLEMLQGSNLDRDYQMGMEAYDISYVLGLHIDSLLTLYYIHSLMKNHHDRIIIKGYRDRQCRSSAALGERVIDRINKVLPSIKSIALVNEITKMRDAIDGMMKTLEICKK